MKIRRGDVFYVKYSQTTGSEQQAGRPAIVVSNAICNEFSQVIEVVYLTAQPKKMLPTHVVIMSTGRKSTALCEQISSVDISRLGDYKCHVTDDEMDRIDAALLCSLGLKRTHSAEAPQAQAMTDDTALALVALRFLQNYLQNHHQTNKGSTSSLDLPAVIL